MSGERKVPAQCGQRLTNLNMFREFSTLYMGDGTRALYRRPGHESCMGVGVGPCTRGDRAKTLNRGHFTR